LVIATHGHCFDGMASAVLFSWLLDELEGRRHELRVRACGYGIGQPRPADAFEDGALNAILDYRFDPDERLHWYFDHHRTAFADDAERAVFDRRVATGRYFYDGARSSCTKLITDVAREKFGLAAPQLSELVAWADKIDTASFASAEEAIDRSEPVMRLTTVLEQHGDDKLLAQLVPMLRERPLAEVASLPDIRRRYAPLGRKHDQFRERMQQHSELIGRVVLTDLSDAPLEVVGKFVGYALYPDTTYSVVLARLRTSLKIAVGYNPWCGKPLDTDISALCARHGGGGHPVVGGISLPVSQLAVARQIARELAIELDSPR